MASIGLVDSNADGYIDLDGQFLICDAAGTTTDDECTGAVEVFGNYDAGPPVVYAGAPFVLISHGKDWNEGAAAGDQLENLGALSTTVQGTAGPTATVYLIKNLAGGETTFVRRITGFADDFDDVVKWVSPNILYSKMIEAGQLP